LGEIRVLVVVKTRPLMRVIEYLLCTQPNLRVVARSSNGGRLAKYAACLKPELIVAQARVFDTQTAKAVAEVKRSSPDSKLILICSFQRSPRQLRKSGADACLLEEALVRQLISVVRKLAPSVDRSFPNSGKTLQATGTTRRKTTRKER
jgi:DNA-binding NarL/FixJ family response regulator